MLIATREQGKFKWKLRIGNGSQFYQQNITSQCYRYQNYYQNTYYQYYYYYYHYYHYYYHNKCQYNDYSFRRQHNPKLQSLQIAQFEQILEMFKRRTLKYAMHNAKFLNFLHKTEEQSLYTQEFNDKSIILYRYRSIGIIQNVANCGCCCA